MTTVFIAGSISISHLHQKVQERISKIIASNFNVVVGDADGADTSIQECLCSHYANKVTVYCTGQTPRNNVGNWPVHYVHSETRAGTRAFFTAKDLEMVKKSDSGLMIWDCKSTGTLSNVIELLKAKKKSIVFINKNKEFVTIGDKSSLNHLLSFMSEHTRLKADKKIDLSAKIFALNQESFLLDEPVTPISTVQLAFPSEPSTADITKTQSMKLRALLISALTDYIMESHLSQLQAAKVLGVTQPRISDLTLGKVDLFSLDMLVNMASIAGLHVEMRVERNVLSSTLKMSCDL